MKKLPEPKDELGYTREEIFAICKELKITKTRFNKAFGVNTCALGKDGEPRFYVCDVDRALWVLGFKKLGQYYFWD
jgi:hypothetical protein